MLVAAVVVLLQVLLLVQNTYTESISESGYRQRISLCPADAKEPWTYRGRNGPMYWGETYPQCYGDQQSPIDIQTEQVTQSQDLQKLELSNYDQPMTSANVKNNGHTIQVTPKDGVERYITVNGSRYTLAQFHFHWGYNFAQGSEHLLNTRQYAMELHFVHLNENDEIAVVGVLFQEDRNSNGALQKIIETFPEVKYKDQMTELKSSVNLSKLIPENPASYYRYQGSLTTPACAEGVTWSVLTQVISVGKKQMAEFRKLYSVTEKDALPFCGLSRNFRPVQPLNDREVLVSQ